MKRISMLILIMTLVACATPLTLEQQAKKERMDAIGKRINESYADVSYVSISCVGHADIPVTGFLVRELARNQYYGGGGCGGTNAAGYPLPDRWRPGMKVTVRWKLDRQPWRETTSNIMRYDEVGTLFVHIYNNDQVRVVSSNTYPDGAMHPISGNSKIPPPEDQ